MTNLTAELASLAERQVPAVNNQFDISPHAAARLWSEGVPLPTEGDYPTDYYPSPGRILRSADGRWIIRRQAEPSPDGVLSTHETVAKAMEELERLQEFGIDVISRAMTTSPMANTVFTVSPWIADLEMCDEEVYRTALAPKVRQYFRQAAGGLALSDINKEHQYSYSSTTEGQPFLHDPDPELAPILI